MIGRADIEGSKSHVAMNAWRPQASYPYGNFSDTSSLKLWDPVLLQKLKDRWDMLSHLIPLLEVLVKPSIGLIRNTRFLTLLWWPLYTCVIF